MIADTIIVNYENNLDKLPSRRRLHFLLRCYRITGDKKYIPQIRTSVSELLPRFKKTLGAFSNEDNIIEIGKQKIIDYVSVNPRKMRRLAFYQKNPKVLVYMEAILYMFLIKSLGMERSPEISREFRVAKSYIASNDIENIFLHKSFMIVNPSESANIINFLSFLGIADKRRELVNLSREYWLNVEPENPSIWLDKIYGLVHLIIGASNYYQNFVDDEQFDWVFKYFDSNLGHILLKANLDSVGEIGICYKLTGKGDSKIVKQIQDYLVSKFDAKVGYIPGITDPTISGSEHRNIVAVIALKDFDRLYKGPDIGE
jgi:hypothetical protein